MHTYDPAFRRTTTPPQTTSERPDEVYLVLPQDARLLTPEERAATEQTPPSMAAIAVIATMFTRGKGLPGDVVAQILALGGLHYCCDAVTTEVLQGSNNMDQLYLEVAIPTREQLRLPSGLELAECLEVMVDCCSHDQGWASLDQELNGTYRSSFTWSELEVTKQPLPEAMEEIVIPRTTASVNLRASRAFRWHRKIFDHNDPVVAKVTPGCKCRLYMRSQYPGWINSVNYGRIKVSFALEIEDTRESVA